MGIWLGTCSILSRGFRPVNIMESGKMTNEALKDKLVNLANECEGINPNVSSVLLAMAGHTVMENNAALLRIAEFCGEETRRAMAQIRRIESQNN